METQTIIPSTESTLALLSSQQLFVQQCEDLLTTPCDLLTITGAPGVGKSTILHALHAEHTRMLDLRGVHDEVEMIAALANTLDLHYEPPRGSQPELEPRRVQIIDALRDPQAPRLLLDHTEHLHTPLQDLLSRLDENPHATLVIASRRAMACGKRLELAPLHASDARELLLAGAPRARRVALARDPHALDLLIDALEHNPLAIRICAPRLGLFTPQDILTRLTQKRGTHASLSEAFAWSWDLLDDDARDDLSRCAACIGWFDDTLATHLLQVDSPEQAHQRLGTLRDHSMLEVTECHGALQYRLAKPLLMFLDTRPAVSTNIALARQHIAHHIAAQALALHVGTLGNRWSITPMLLPELVAQHMMPTLRWWQQAWDNDPTLDTLAHLVETVLGVTMLLWKQQDFTQTHALHTFVAESILPHPLFAQLSLELRVRMACTRSDYFTILHDSHAAYDTIQQLDTWNANLPPELELLQLIQLSELEPQLANDKAQAHIDRAIAIARELDEQEALAGLLLAHARVRLDQRQMNEAIEALEQARDFCNTLPNKGPLARVLLFLGFTLHAAGKQSQGHAVTEQAREAFIVKGDIISAAHALKIRAWQCVDDRDFAHSKVLIDEMLVIATRHGLSWMHAFGFFLLGQHELDQERYSQALITYERARYHLERNNLDAILAASQLYRSICYKLTGDMEMARHIYEEGLAHIEAIRSMPGKLHYMCERAEWAAHHCEYQEANEILESARTLLDGCHKQDILPLMVEVYQCKINLAHYFTMREQKKPTKHLYRNILKQLSRLHVPSEGSDNKPLDSCIEVRLAWAQLMRQLPEEFLRRFLVELKDPQAKALLIDASQLAYRAPGCYDWISLGRKENPYNLLLLLVAHHLDTPGKPVDESIIMAHLWPDEQHISPESARNRLYVTLSSLRTSGNLKTAVLNHNGGYMLAEHLAIFEV